MSYYSFDVSNKDRKNIGWIWMDEKTITIYHPVDMVFTSSSTKLCFLDCLSIFTQKQSMAYHKSKSQTSDASDD